MKREIDLRWLVNTFDKGLEEFYTNDGAPFSMFRKGPCIHFHVRTINKLKDLLNQYDSYLHVCNNLEYAELLYATLTAWGMNPIGGRIDRNRLKANEVGLQNFCVFQTTLKELDVVTLDHLKENKLAEVDYSQLEGLKKHVKMIYDFLAEKRVMKSTRAIVGVSKVLHHLLPHLLMPVDTEHILKLLNKLKDNDYRPPSTNNFDTFEAYWRCIKVSWYICKEKKLSSASIETEEYPMNTSTPKIIDNALIGMSSLAGLIDSL